MSDKGTKKLIESIDYGAIKKTTKKDVKKDTKKTEKKKWQLFLLKI